MFCTLALFQESKVGSTAVGEHQDENQSSGEVGGGKMFWFTFLLQRFSTTKQQMMAQGVEQEKEGPTEVEKTKVKP